MYHSCAVMLFADIDSISECGVFVIRGGAGKLYDIEKTQEMFRYRLRQISLIFPQSDGKILRYGSVVVYIVSEDNERAERLFSRLI